MSPPRSLSVPDTQDLEKFAHMREGGRAHGKNMNMSLVSKRVTWVGTSERTDQWSASYGVAEEAMGIVVQRDVAETTRC